MGFILRFHEIYIVEREFLLLVLFVCEINTALTRPNAIEGLVVVSYAKQLHLFTSKARIEWLLRGEDNELTQSLGQRGFILTVELYSTMVSIINACM